MQHKPQNLNRKKKKVTLHREQGCLHRNPINPTEGLGGLIRELNFSGYGICTHNTQLLKIFSALYFH
jgi:hypothetical protein